jgi:hypothetical protein
LAKRGQIEQAQAQIGIGGVQSVDRVLERHPQALVQVKLAGVGLKLRFNVATAFPSQLGKGHDATLLEASQSAHARVPRLALDDSRKACLWNEFHNLSKKGLADIDMKPPRVLSLGNYTGMKKQGLNRHQTKSDARPRQYWLSLKIDLV